jgi:hypothetical protein
MQTLLLPYHDDAVCDAALAAACLTAQRFNSHVEALYVREVPQIIVSEIIPAAYVTQINDQTGRSAETARAHFARGLEPFGLRMAELDGPAHAPTAGWREATGRESEIVGDYGRLFDLIVVARAAGPCWWHPPWRPACLARISSSPGIARPRRRARLPSACRT